MPLTKWGINEKPFLPFVHISESSYQPSVIHLEGDEM